MNIFITGTDTEVGKTIISAWIAVHTGFSYFKPIQTGSCDGRDAQTVHDLSGALIHPEQFIYQEPVAPYLAALLENRTLDIEQITLPRQQGLIVEGVGGVLVPLNEKQLVVDLIAYLNLPVILVARTQLGTINHTLLSLNALRARNISVLGVIMNGKKNSANAEAISFYGKVEILAEFPHLEILDDSALARISFSKKLHTLFLE